MKPIHSPAYKAGAVLAAALALAGCRRVPEPEAAATAVAAEPTAAEPTAAEPSASATAPASLVQGDAQPEVEDAEAHYDQVHGKGKEHDHHDHFQAEGTLVSNHGVPLLQETQTSGGFDPAKRAQIVAQRLNDMAESHGLEAEHIVTRVENGVPTVFFFHRHKAGEPGHVLATLDPRTAGQFGYGSRPGILAFWWRDVLRDHALIVSGQPPVYTTPYAQPLQRLYVLCQRARQGVPTHESFEKALEGLTQPERDALQSLYISVPANYRPQPDDPPAIKGKPGQGAPGQEKPGHGGEAHGDGHRN